jgi:hypothetical protein
MSADCGDLFFIYLFASAGGDRIEVKKADLPFADVLRGHTSRDILNHPYNIIKLARKKAYNTKPYDIRRRIFR